MNIPNTRVYSVAGQLSAGADWADTLDSDTGQVDLDGFIALLEPAGGKSGALCVSSDDWLAMQTALEQLCKKVGSQCSYSVKKSFNEAFSRVSELQARAMQ